MSLRFRLGRALGVCASVVLATLPADVARADGCQGVACAELKITKNQVRNDGSRVIHVIVHVKGPGGVCRIKVFDGDITLSKGASKDFPDGICEVEATFFK
jgi:hypothetical protein